ncbi:MAG: hypothetical protein JEZ11_18635 [Desulfobacterales bacterium]|nr:hypothetical protein [Desulfobacterales bacterium]
MTYALIAIGVVAATILAGFILSGKKKSRPKEPIFICDHCGEHHCECRLEDNDKGPVS